MDIAAIQARVDDALRANRRAEGIVIGMALGIFVLGVGAFLYGYVEKNPYVAGGSTLLGGLLYWPIKEVLKVRRDNLVLQVVPIMAAQLAPKDFAIEIRKTMDHLRGKQR